MKVKITTRFGEVKEFERKEKVFRQLKGESFERALFRTYYPRDYEKSIKLNGKWEYSK